MANDRDTIAALLLSAIDEVNQRLSEEQRIKKSLDTKLSEELDSLGLINFVVVVEEKIREQLRVTITLTDERAMSQINSPFLSTQALVSYIMSLLEEQYAQD